MSIARRKPLVGVTFRDNGYFVSWIFIWWGLRQAGVKMVRLQPKKPQFGLVLDGLVLSGGSDIDPHRYNKDRKPNYYYDMPREDMERQWLDHAHKAKLPILGICRGAQLLNVFRGGSLYLDIRLVCETARYPGGFFSRILYRKPVVIKPDSRLEKIFKAQHTQVNSLHRQSLDEIGEGLTVTAWEENTIVQAIEGNASAPFTLGVQWHPEFMPFSVKQRRLFKAFANAVRSRLT